MEVLATTLKNDQQLFHALPTSHQRMLPLLLQWKEPFSLDGKNTLQSSFVQECLEECSTEASLWECPNREI